MKKTTGTRFCFFSFLFFFLLLASTKDFAQNRKLDSLRQLLAHSKSDTVSSKYLWRIGRFYFEQKNDHDSALLFLSQGYALAARHDFLFGMWINLGEQCLVYQRNGNYQKALQLYLDFLKYCEEKKEISVRARVLNFISDLYIRLEDYSQAISYAQKNTPIIIESQIGGSWLMGNLYNIGICFIHLNQPDSALAYFQQGFAWISQHKPDRGGPDRILIGLGMANAGLGNHTIAMAYFEEAIRNEKEFNTDVLYLAYLQKAELLQKLNQTDSSATYYEYALQTIAGNYKDRALIYKALANIYLAKDPVRSVKYFVLEQKLTDSLFASDKINAIRALTYNEQERQKELVNKAREEAEEHKKNIENISITIGIIGFLTLFLLLSRTIIVNGKWIRFLGVMGLLVLFEFINLLLHPLVGTLTHHSSVYMLLIMVGIAALLVPLHHKIEKWVTNKMIEKNKRIRIAAARRTIAQLEKDAPSSHSETN
ncbi:tetratricopeptide repeat protein [Sediminibacterium soli]|uniref:tetratricopeptide repeat protein n=1 Tax=Sediminibacterium soli TaxID=2698829 RepID=UPI00137A79E8|nr:tetratricopeptide repeat protein [Sediminibacterium soli]NCI48271.1 tetratricopeptide repeat protein [Sediminibacterium soli]